MRLPSKAHVARWCCRRQSAIRRSEGARSTTYGLHCQACGLVPKVAQQIEVHHLDPISDGVRRTRLEDLRPLCRNYSLAHSTSPPKPVEILAKIAAA